MTEWHLAKVSDETLDLSEFGSIPLELDPRWLRSRIDGADKDIRFFLLGDQQRPQGYAPFFVHRSELSYCLGETTVFSIPVLRYAMQGAPLCENGALLSRLFTPLREAIGKRGVVFFEGVPAHSSLDELFRTPDSPVHDLFHLVPYGPAYTRRLIELPVGAQFEDYLQTLGSKTREDVRRTRKYFGVKAGCSVTVVRYTESAQMDELVAALAQISRKTYQYHLLGLGFDNTAELAAHLVETATRRWLRAYILRIGDTPVAFGLGYCFGDTYYGHHVGYDPAISKLQPGIYLHTEVMADLLSDGIRHFDFLPGDSLYKQRMSNRVREERHYYLIPRGWPGTIYARGLLAVNSLSETIGRWLAKSGLKGRLRRTIRAIAVKRSRSED